MLNKRGLAEQINIEQGTARSTSCRPFSCLTNLAAGLSKEKLSHGNRNWQNSCRTFFAIAQHCVCLTRQR
jgi:hypothetical protein